jgi:WD40 repeat protein
MEVHCCRFIDYVPCAVQCLSWDETGEYLAVGRSNADIEIYQVSSDFVLFLTIAGGTDMSVEALCWSMQGTNRRLFSAGLTALIIEWDLLTGRPKVEMKKSHDDSFFFMDEISWSSPCLA